MPAAMPRLLLLVWTTALLQVAAPAARGAEPASAAVLGPADLVGEVLARADDRLATMPAVAAAKWAQHQPVGDPARESAVTQAAGDRAAELGLVREPVVSLFALQVRLARAAQESLFERWQRGEALDERGPAQSLGAELRPRLDRLTGELVEALYLAAPVLSDPDAATRFAAVARERLPGPRWSAADRAELLAALTAVRLAAPRSLARARAAHVLRIGTPADYAPFSVEAGGRVVGADVALALRLAAALGLRPVFLRSSWRALLADLEADRFDIAVGGISVTPARLAVASFSLPIAHGGKTAIGRCADRDRFGTLAAIDRPEVRIIENAGGTNEAFARDTLHAAMLRIQPDNRTVFDEIVAQRADVMFTDDTEVALATHRHPKLCRLLAELYAPADKAILLPQDPSWAATVNEWLAPEIARGTPARLLAEQLAQ
jgi:cyclohexadienyl dehydratase